MKALANYSQFLSATQTVESILQDFDVKKPEKAQIEDHAQSTPARGVILGVVGGIGLWAVIIWAAIKIF